MGKKNTMSDLRDHLFDTIERLKDPDPATPMDVQTAKVIVDSANALIDSQRVQNDYIKAIGGENYLQNGNNQSSRFLNGDNGE